MSTHARNTAITIRETCLDDLEEILQHRRHYSGIVGDGYRTLQEGTRVSFAIIQGTKGPQATNLVKLD